jgi:hypothetical protein
MTHAGVRVGFPSKLVLSVASASAGLCPLSLWPGAIESVTAETRVFMVVTAVGPRPILGSAAAVLWLGAESASPITPFLRHFMTLPHIVGLAELGGVMTWLLDPSRLVPDDAGAPHPEASFAA